MVGAVRPPVSFPIKGEPMKEMREELNLDGWMEQSGGDRRSQVHRRPPSLSGYGWASGKSRVVV